MQIGTKTVQSMQIGNKTVQNIITSDGSYIYDRGEIDMTVVISNNNATVEVKTIAKGKPSSQSVFLQYKYSDSFILSETKTTSATTGTTIFTLSGIPSTIIAHTMRNGNEISKQMTSIQYSYSAA